MENQTDHAGAFAIASLARNATAEDLGAYLVQAANAFEETGKLPDVPACHEQVVRGGAQAGETTFLSLTLARGYALVCFVDDPPLWQAHAAAQLEVGA